MAHVLSIVGGSGEPLKILGPGANPDNPNLSDIIFDANHATHLLMQKGVITTPGTWYTNGGGASSPVVLSRQVTGRRPICLISSAPPSAIGSYYEIPYKGGASYSGIPGGGGAVGLFGRHIGGVGYLSTETHFYGVNFNTNSMTSIGGVTQIFISYRTIHYVILSNTI